MSSRSRSSTSDDSVNCQEDCPYLMPCGNCTDCSNRNNCDNFSTDMVSDKCTQCFSYDDNIKDKRGYHIDVFMNSNRQTQRFGVRRRY